MQLSDITLRDVIIEFLLRGYRAGRQDNDEIFNYVSLRCTMYRNGERTALLDCLKKLSCMGSTVSL